MKILISNDDGIDAPGLRALAAAFAEHYEVYVVAPNKERSAMGHSLTLHRPLRIEKAPAEYFPKVQEAYSIDGTPTDCIKIAVNKIFPFSFDWVLSGINHGPNMGADILYSGTVSAAIEGAIYNVKSIAFSLAEYKADDFEEQADLALETFRKVEKSAFAFRPQMVLNVNIPNLSASEIKGFAVTELASRMYTDAYDRRVDPRGRYYYWLSGDLLQSDPDPNSDITKTAQGYISVTPVTFNMTAKNMLADLDFLTNE